MSGPYTLTIHVAEGGTPTFDPDRKVWEDAKDTSSAGHMWYSVRDESLADGHPDKENSYGFAPEDGKSGVTSVPGEVSPYDNNIYHQPLYGRTLEISEEQYTRLKEFGQNGMDKQWDFFGQQYHSVNNSCVDFTWGALAHAGIEHHEPGQFHGPNAPSRPDYTGPIRPGFKPDLIPSNNRDDVDRVIDPKPGSSYNKTHHGPPAKEVSAGLRRERAKAFKDNPQAALAQFPEYAPLHAAKETLDTVSKRYSASRGGGAIVKRMHNELTNRLGRGAAIPNPQQATRMIHAWLVDREYGD